MFYVIESSVGWSKEGPEIISTIPNAEGKKNCFLFLNIDKPPGHLTLKIILNILFYYYKGNMNGL